MLDCGVRCPTQSVMRDCLEARRRHGSLWVPNNRSSHRVKHSLDLDHGGAGAGGSSSRPRGGTSADGIHRRLRPGTPGSLKDAFEPRAWQRSSRHSWRRAPLVGGVPLRSETDPRGRRPYIRPLTAQGLVGLPVGAGTEDALWSGMRRTASTRPDEEANFREDGAGGNDRRRGRRETRSTR